MKNIKLDQTRPLSPSETEELDRHETTIRRGLETFLEVGRALQAIKQKRLYRGGYSSFEVYLRERWDLSRPRAYQLIGAAEVVENLEVSEGDEGHSPTGVLPENEAQVRPLAHLEPARQRNAWARAVATAPKGRVTARHVRAVVKEMGREEPEVILSTTVDIPEDIPVIEEAPAMVEEASSGDSSAIDYDAYWNPDAGVWWVVSHNGAINVGLPWSEDAPIDLVIDDAVSTVTACLDEGTTDDDDNPITDYRSFVIWKRYDVAAVATALPGDPNRLGITYF